MTPLEREVVLGCLLGDGSCTKSGKNYRLRIEHQAAHREYVEWKIRLLERLCVTEPRAVKAHDSFRFGTVGHPGITYIRGQFYPNGLKAIPRNMPITPLMLSILFMDDGGRIHSTGNISLHSYCDDDVDYMVAELARLGVSTKPHYDGHEKRGRLYIETASYRAFERLIKPYVAEVRCMEYKLVLTP